MDAFAQLVPPLDDDANETQVVVLYWLKPSLLWIQNKGTQLTYLRLNLNTTSVNADRYLT